MSTPPTYMPDEGPLDLSIVVALFAAEFETFARLQGTAMHLCTRKEPPATELVLVGNGEHGTAMTKMNTEAAERHLKVATFSHNTGVAAAWNAGISLAEGRNVVIVNEDCYPTEETFVALSTALDEHPDWGIVGVEGHDLAWAEERPEDRPRPGCWRAVKSYGAPRFEAVGAEGREVTFVTGFCFAMRKADLVEVGKFSETYSPIWNEDTDIAFRFRRDLKKKSVVIPGVAPHDVGISKPQPRNRALRYLRGAVRIEEHKWHSNYLMHRRWWGAPSTVTT